MDRPKHTNREATEILNSEHSLEGMIDFYNLLSMMIDRRLDDDSFEDVVKFVLNLDRTSITHMTESEEEEQLKFCSQWKFTFAQLGGEVGRHLAKTERSYKIWTANKNKLERERILQEQRAELGGLRTKGNYGKITIEEIQTAILCNHEQEYLEWWAIMDKMSRARDFLNNLVEDITHRSICLSSINKRRASALS